MSSRSGKKRTRAKRGGGKSKEVKQPGFRIGVTGAFVPSLMRTSLKHTVAWSAQADGAMHYYHLSGNNAKDPGGTLTSSSPPGFQYLAALYERYRVIGSKISVSFANATDTKDTTSLAFLSYCTVAPSNNNTAWSAYSSLASQPYAKSGECTTQTPLRLNQSMSTALILGQKDLLGSDRTQATIGTGPNDEWFWSIGVQTNVDMSTANDVNLTAEVTFDIEFFDRSGTLTPAMDALVAQIYALRCKAQEEVELRRKERTGLHWSSSKPPTAEVSRGVEKKEDGSRRESSHGWTKLKSSSMK